MYKGLIMEFKNEIALIQRRMAASIAGTSRRLEILNALDIELGQHVLDIGCGGGHLLEEIAKAVGKKRVTISNSLRLLKLPSEIRSSLRKGVITAGHARAILQGKTVSQMIQAWKKNSKQ